MWTWADLVAVEVGLLGLFSLPVAWWVWRTGWQPEPPQEPEQEKGKGAQRMTVQELIEELRKYAEVNPDVYVSGNEPTIIIRMEEDGRLVIVLEPDE